MSDTSAESGKAGRYGVGAQTTAPSGNSNEGDTARRVGLEDVGGPSRDIAGTQYDQSQSTSREHTSRGQSDLARPEDFEGQPQHNDPPRHEWVGPEGQRVEPLGADTSPTQHPRSEMRREGENYTCPVCGAVARGDDQAGGNVWCDGVNQGIG